MKKLLLIIFLFSLTVGKVNAQDGPSKKETFEFIVQLLDNMENGRHDRGPVKQSVTEFDEISLTLTFVQKFYESWTTTFYLDLTRLKSVSENDAYKNWDYEIALYFKNGMKYYDDDGDTGTEDDIRIYFDKIENINILSNKVTYLK